MGMISVKGAIDLHIHSAPCLYPRIGDDTKIAIAARDAGMEAIAFKSPFESTVSRAYHTMKEVPGIKVYGGLVLNHFVGGINPYAVDVALRLGGKLIWMPTIHAANHERIYGATGKYEQKSMDANVQASGISILRDGKLIDEAKSVVDLVARHNAILGTSHLSQEEIEALAKHCCDVGGVKLVITHPEWKIPNLKTEFLKEMMKLGACVEYVASSIGPLTFYAPPDVTRQAIEYLGPERVILSSDCGVAFYPMPAEALRMFAHCLHEVGVSEAHLQMMMCENQKKLLGI